MKKCPGTLFANCEGQFIDDDVPLCKKCLDGLKKYRDELMGLEPLRKEFVGKNVDIVKMGKAGWCTKGSPKYPFGFPEADGMWINQLNFEECLGYLLIALDKEARISTLEVLTIEVGAGGGMDTSLVHLGDASRGLIDSACRVILKG